MTDEQVSALFKSIESVELVRNMVKWVWVDCFNNFPLNTHAYWKIKLAGLKICIVSPELQNHNIERINEFKTIGTFERIL